MPGRVSWPIEPGGLQPVHHEAIVALAERGLGPSPIARRLGKHPSTVGWFMHRNGLLRLKRCHHAGAFGAEEDALIEGLRVEGLGHTEIARRATERFGRRRTAHTIAVRLTMLAGDAEARS